MGENDDNAPAWALELMQELKNINAGLAELKKAEQPQKFSFPDAIADWLKSKEQERDPAQRMDDVYGRKHEELDERGWPIPKKEREIPDELVIRAMEVAKQKIKAIETLMGGDDQ